MASITQLGYVGISAKDVDEWERFATETLGLQISGKEPDGTLFLRMDEYQYRFAVQPTGKDDVERRSAGRLAERVPGPGSQEQERDGDGTEDRDPTHRRDRLLMRLSSTGVVQ